MPLEIPFPRVTLSHSPTPLELMPNLTKLMSGPELWIKRDDCTGLAMGGNKARQLEFYVGQALEKGADTLLTTGAVQSNHVRMTIAAARKMGLKVEVQLELRVSDQPKEYYESGNPLLMKLMGAKIHSYPVGEDEDGADKSLYALADKLKQTGASPYVIPLSGLHTPYGALGYVNAADELVQQMHAMDVSFDAIVVASGSANTHAGLLFGLRLLGNPIKVYGICVRREAKEQFQRVITKTNQLADMFGIQKCVTEQDIFVDDVSLKPGYGLLSEHVIEAIQIAAKSEGILLDPTYTGKSMAGLLRYVRQDKWASTQRVMFLHTGGTPGIFGYPQIVNT